MTAPQPAPIAYLTSMYPKASHTFILREITSLEAAGIAVLPCSIRRPPAAELIGPEEEAEHARTFYVISEALHRPLRFLAAHWQALTRHPGRYLGTLVLALRFGVPGLRGRLYQAFYFAEAVLLAEHLRRAGVRHVHDHLGASSGSVAMLSAALLEIPFSFTAHGPDIFFNPHDIGLGLKIERAAFVICISHFCRSQCMIFADPAQWDKLQIMHCGVDPEKYVAARTETPGKRLIFIGRLARVKGVPILLEALSRLVADDPDLSLTIVGDGPDRAQIEAQIATLGLSGSVTLAGYLSQDRVAEELARSDIMVLPSFAEGVPIVLMEAMASGRPVITSRIAGIPELVEDGVSGFLVPAGDAEGLAERIRRLIRDPELQIRMGQAGRAKIAQEFTIGTEIRRLVEHLGTAGAG